MTTFCITVFSLFFRKPPFRVLLRALNRLRPLYDLCNKPGSWSPNNIILRMSAAILTPLDSMSHFRSAYVDYTRPPGCCVASGEI